jgi:hypothetical protein
MTHSHIHTDTCTWIGPVGIKPTCSHPAVLASYCAEHYALVYARGTRLGRRVKDLRRAEELRQLVSLFNQAVEELEAEGFDCYGESELGLDLDKATF